LPYADFATMVRNDAIQYRNQYPDFEHDPVGEMQGVLKTLHLQKSIEHDYRIFLAELVFGEPVSYTEAKYIFIDLAGRFLAEENRV